MARSGVTGWTAALAASLAVSAALTGPWRLLTLSLFPLIFGLCVLLASLCLVIGLAWLAANRGARAPNCTRLHPVVPRLSIATPAGLETIRIRKQWLIRDVSFRKPLHPTSTAVSAAVDELIAAILENHLLSWYTVAISPSDPTFPHAVERTIRESMAGLRDRVVRVDWANVGVSVLLPRITRHLELFDAAQQSLGESSLFIPTDTPSSSGEIKATSARAGVPLKPKPKPKVQSKSAAAPGPASEEMDLLLANKYAELATLDSAGSEQLRPVLGLHRALTGAGLNSKPGEEKHLRHVVSQVLGGILPPKERASGAVTSMAVEIVACAILRPTIEALADPDQWNRLIDEKGGNAIREQRMVDKLRAALDATQSAAPLKGQTEGAAGRSGAITVTSTAKQFESFLRSIGRCPNLVEGKRVRNDIDYYLRRARLPGAYPEQSPEIVLKYIDRLAVARQAIDRRISELGGEQSGAAMNASAAISAELRDVLHNPGALLYFMEFMDRRHRSKQVQFYLTIEGLKGPLEASEAPQIAESDTQSRPVISSAIDALEQDVQLLLEVYLDSGVVICPPTDAELLRKFRDACGDVEKRASIPESVYRATRQSLFRAQAKVYEDMLVGDWPEFQRTDLYNKALSALPRRTLQTDVQRPHPAHRALSTPKRGSQVATDATPLTRPRLRMQSAQSLEYTSPAASRTVSAGSERSQTGSSIGREPRTDSSEHTAETLGFLTGIRNVTSIEGNAVRSPLFQDESDSMFASKASLDSHGDEPDTVAQLQTMQAIQDALTSILADDEENAGLRKTREGSVSSGTSDQALSSKASPERTVQRHRQRLTPPMVSPTSSKPLEPILHKRTTSASTGAAKTVADSTASERIDYGQVSDLEDSLSLSAELQLRSVQTSQPPSADLDKVRVRMPKLENQIQILGDVLERASLTSTEEEVRVLERSILSLKRELRELSFQKEQLEGQVLGSNIVFGRTTANITGTSIAQSAGKDFALYLIEVQVLENPLSYEGSLTKRGWLVTRRFSEFVQLHSALRDKYSAVRSLDFPQKRLVTSLSSSLLEHRRAGLEKYLQALLGIPEVCEERILRSFLSQQNISLRTSSPGGSTTSPGAAGDFIPGQSLLRNLFRSVTSSIDDMLGGPSMLDTIILRLSQQAADFASGVGGTTDATNDDLVSAVVDGASDGNNAPIDLLALSAGLEPADGEGLTSFTAPVANLLVEVFDLKDKGSWLRRQAIVIILQQVLGGTIERKVREAVTLSVAGDALLPHVKMVSNLLYPGGKLKSPAPIRTAEEKLQTRDSAYQKLAFLLPDVAASVIGRSNARRGARRLFAVLQNKRLTQHLIYTLLDDVLVEIFGKQIL